MQVHIDQIIKMTKSLLYPHAIQKSEDMLEWITLQNIFQQLLPEYEDREYHNLLHIFKGLQLFTKLHYVHKIAIPKEVVIAWLLHDVLSSEKETAKLVNHVLHSTTLTDHSVYIIDKCIQATAFYSDKHALKNYFDTHQIRMPSKSKTIQSYFLIALADLQVLWENEHEYFHYADAVKDEIMKIHNMTAHEFNQKRIEFLTNYIDNGFFPHIECIKNIEERIKHNLIKEIKLLSDQ